MASDSRPIAIRLNGEAHSMESGLTVAALLEQLDKDPRTVAIEWNGTILPRESYAKTQLAEGDSLEVVQFVQGG